MGTIQKGKEQNNTPKVSTETVTGEKGEGCSPYTSLTALEISRKRSQGRSFLTYFMRTSLMSLNKSELYFCWYIISLN